MFNRLRHWWNGTDKYAYADYPFMPGAQRNGLDRYVSPSEAARFRREAALPLPGFNSPYRNVDDLTLVDEHTAQALNRWPVADGTTLGVMSVR